MQLLRASRMWNQLGAGTLPAAAACTHPDLDTAMVADVFVAFLDHVILKARTDALQANTYQGYPNTG